MESVYILRWGFRSPSSRRSHPVLGFEIRGGLSVCVSFWSTPLYSRSVSPSSYLPSVHYHRTDMCQLPSPPAGRKDLRGMFPRLHGSQTRYTGYASDHPLPGLAATLPGNQPCLTEWTCRRDFPPRDHVPVRTGIGVSSSSAFIRFTVCSSVSEIFALTTCHLGGDVLGFQFYCRRGSVPKGHPQSRLQLPRLILSESAPRWNSPR